MSEVQDELKPLPAEKLCNKNKPNPIKGDGPLGNEKIGHMYYVGNDKKEVVITLQKMLKTLGYDLGTSGPDKDGVDGDFRDTTENAVKDFQEKNKDWDGKQLLEEDGLVGPKTSDALNRAMVGINYPKYETPEELTLNYHVITITKEEFQKNGLIIPADSEKLKRYKIYLVPPPFSIQFVITAGEGKAVPNVKYHIEFTNGEIIEEKADLSGNVILNNLKSNEFTLKLIPEELIE